MKWTKANRRKYMREYMRKYVRRVNKIGKHPREIIEHKTPTPKAHKVDSRAKSREKIEIPPPKNPVESHPLTCPECGMLRPLVVGPCRYCGPGAENRKHPAPPAPRLLFRRGRPKVYPRLDEEDEIVSREAGF